MRLCLKRLVHNAASLEQFCPTVLKLLCWAIKSPPKNLCLKFSHTTPKWSAPSRTLLSLHSSLSNRRWDADWKWPAAASESGACLKFVSSKTRVQAHLQAVDRGHFSVPLSLFLRGLEGWHAEADLNVPRLSLNLHVGCQLPCHSRAIAPTLTRNTAQMLWPRTWRRRRRKNRREQSMENDLKRESASRFLIAAVCSGTQKYVKKQPTTWACVA